MSLITIRLSDPRVAQIASDRFAEISALACNLWQTFVVSRGDKYLVGGLLSSDYKEEINPVAYGFFKHCVDMTLPAGDLLEEQSKKVRNANWLKHRLDGERKAPSWLWKKADGAPCILMDFGQVHRHFREPLEDKKIRTRLFLHETGHVVLHYAALNNVPGAVIHPGVNADQEEEAWIFCGLILGLALGRVARSGRSLEPPVIDLAWETSC